MTASAKETHTRKSATHTFLSRTTSLSHFRERIVRVILVGLSRSRHRALSRLHSRSPVVRLRCDVFVMMMMLLLMMVLLMMMMMMVLA